MTGIQIPVEQATLLDNLGATVVSTTVRGTLVLLLVWLVFRLWRRASAAQQHLGWILACVVMLGIVVTQFVVPAWEAPILPVTQTSHAQINMQQINAILIDSYPQQQAISTSYPAGLLLLFTIWGLGIIVCLGFLAVSHLRAQRLIQQSIPVTDRKLQHLFEYLHRSLAIRQHVIVRHHETAIPMSYGIWTPAILLPADLTTWTEDKLRDVLTHELAHIKRKDCLTHSIASVICAFQWFNPMVWYTLLQLKTLREEACDNYVLTAGSHPSHYALHLLDLVEMFHTSPVSDLAAAPFARKTQLQHRLQAIMSARRIRTPLTIRNSATMFSLSAVLTVPFAVVTPVPRHIRPLEVSDNLLRMDVTQRQIAGSDVGSATRLSVPGAPTKPDSPSQKNLTMKNKIAPLVAATLLSAAPALAQDTAEKHRVDTVYITLEKSIDSILSKTVTTGVTRHLQDILEVRVPGFSVHRTSGSPGDSTLNLRLRSAPKQKDPIIIVDGMRVTTSDIHPLDQIAPSNIERIDVLKGPKAVSLYGPEAEHGIIVITTKKKQK